MRYNEVGINLDSIDKLILDIYNYAERVNKTLNQISDVVDQTKNFYAWESADNYRNKFNSFRTNFKVVNKNLISYAEDLIKLKNRYQNMSDEMTQTIKKAIANIEVPNNKWW